MPTPKRPSGATTSPEQSKPSPKAKRPTLTNSDLLTPSEIESLRQDKKRALEESRKMGKYDLSGRKV